MAIPSNYKQELLKILDYFKEKYGTDIIIRTGYDKIRNNYYVIISDKTFALYLNPKFSIELQYFEFAHILYDAGVAFATESNAEYTLNIEDWIKGVQNLD